MLAVVRAMVVVGVMLFEYATTWMWALTWFVLHDRLPLGSSGILHGTPQSIRLYWDCTARLQLVGVRRVV